MASDLGMTLGTFRRWLRDAVELLAACVESIWAEAER
jgi:DNA-directed RNA polymerase specialized sigma24 family protein